MSTAFSATLPSGYTELEYIESNGTQYIDTGVKLSDNDKTYYDVDFEITRNTSYRSLWGAYGGYSSNGDTRTGYLYVGASYLQFAVGASNDAMLTSYPTSGLAGVRHHWLLYVDDNTKERTITNIQNSSIISTSTFSGTLLKNVNICLFGFPGGERSYLKLYSFKITINGTPVRDFIPARRNSDGVLGMYDTVNNVFYTNSGTGTFIAGPVVVAPCGSYTELEYIESTGTQVIDTGFVYNNNTRVIWDVQLTATLPLSDSQGFGVGYVQNNTERLGFSFEGKDVQKFLLFKAKAVGNPDTRIHTIPLDNDRHVIEVNSPTHKGYVDGVEYTFDSSVGTTDNVTNATLPLFCWYSNIDGIKQYSHYSEAKLYSVKIYDNGTLARNMVPARNSDGVVGLCDTVTNTFFENSGTGSFIAGPAVAQPATISIHWGGVAEPDASGMCVYGETFTAPSTAPTAPSGLKFLGWIPR